MKWVYYIPTQDTHIEYVGISSNTERASESVFMYLTIFLPLQIKIKNRNKTHKIIGEAQLGKPPTLSITT